MQTAAVVIIGNEILSGKYADENGPFFVRRLRELGVRLMRLVVVPDVSEIIGAEVRACSESVDHVFTTGGVGPTHDDITMESIAAGFGVPCPRHPELEEVIRKRGHGQVNAAVLRMALAPEGCELWWDGEVFFPTIRFRNVVILPGVPHIMRRKFDAIAHRFQGTPISTARVVTERYESDIAATLSQALSRFPGVEIGSYPRLEEENKHVVVTVEGTDSRQVDACAAWLRSALGNE